MSPVTRHPVTSPCPLLSDILSPVRVPCYQTSCHQTVSPVISHQTVSPVISHPVTSPCPVISHRVISPCPLLRANLSPVRVPCYQSSCHQSVSPVISHQSVPPVISHPVTSPCPVISHRVTSPCPLLPANLSPVRVPCYQSFCHRYVSRYQPLCYNCFNFAITSKCAAAMIMLQS